MNVLIIGMGHIGTWLHKHISKFHPVQTLDVTSKKIKKPITVMHICFPYSVDFISDVLKYIGEYEPVLTIIESTIPPGTTFNIWRKHVHRTGYSELALCHSPIRGTEHNWQTYVKMIGPTTFDSGLNANDYYTKIGIKTQVLRSPLETEVGKLVDTTIYALNIAFCQEIHRMCKALGADPKQAYEDFSRTFTIDPHYSIPRPVFFPGAIGKECLIPNAKLLNKAYPSLFIKAILLSNEQRKIELAQKHHNDMS